MNTKTLIQLFLPLAFMGTVVAVPPPPPEEMDEILSSSPEVETTDNAGLHVSLATPGAPTPQYVAPPAPDELEAAWVFALSAGYATNYDYRGMVAGNILCKSGDVFARAQADYTLPNGMILSGDADYTEIFSGSLKDDDQTRFNLKLKDEILPGLSLNYGYGLVHGGIAGEYAKWTGSSQSLVQQFEFSALYGADTNGYFFGLDVSYAFDGITGWWVGAVAGYKYEVAYNFHAILSAGISGSWSYWDESGLNQVSCKLETPYALTDEWTLSPFVSLNWLGKTGLDMNSAMGERIFRPFTVMAGVGVSYKF